MTDRDSYPATTSSVARAFTKTAALGRASASQVFRVFSRAAVSRVLPAIKAPAAMFAAASALRIAAAFFLAAVLISPAAGPWFAGVSGDDRPKARRPLTAPDGTPVGAVPGEQRHDEEDAEAAWARRHHRTLYPRPQWWPTDMGPRRFRHVPLADVRSPDTLILPGNKGSFRTRRGGPPVIPPGLAKRPEGPPRGSGEYFIVQLDADAVRGKRNAALRRAVAGVGPSIRILDYVPNNAYLVRARGKDRAALRSSALFRYVTPYHPAFKIDPWLGRRKLRSPERAASEHLQVVIRLFRGESDERVVDRIVSGGGTAGYRTEVAGGGSVIAATIHRTQVFDLARLEEVRWIEEKKDLATLALVSSIQTEMGRFIDPRVAGKWVRPFTEEGIDGGGEYVTETGQIPGCGPFDPNAGNYDPDCYLTPPQFVGLVDNGISLDAAPLAHSRTEPCAAPAADCASLVTGTGVGPAHRKVEMYVTSRDVNHDGTPEDATAEGDFLSCDAMNSGGETHGHVAASTMLGNPSEGAHGLGLTFDSKELPAWLREHENELPMDGQARGARLLFIDAQGTGVPVQGPPPCATAMLSDVDAGAVALDDVEALVYRRDLDLTSNAIHERGAMVVVLPFGAPANFDDNVYNGHGSYAGDAEEIDRFLFANRRVTVVVPVGNDGADPATYRDRDPFEPTDPNDGIAPDPLLDPEDIQIQDLATGKNIVSVGGNRESYRYAESVDSSEVMSARSSKGPATVNSLRIAPLVVAPFGGGGGGSREGMPFGYYFDPHTAISSFDDEQDPGEGIEEVRIRGRSGTSFSAANVGGAAAQIRDYFAKGYYPGAEKGSGPALRDVSGALVKAVLVASADFAQLGLIGSCQNKFCIQQGYGKVELANALPLRSYPQTRRFEDGKNLEYRPDVPASILVADELFDGGLGFGVVELGGEAEFPFEVVHGGGSVRVALAWHDAPGELLINNLDLEVIDGDFDRTPGWDVAWGYPDPGTGTCNTPAFDGNGGPFVWTCGYCTLANLSNPDPNWFDPHGSNPYVRRYLGNLLRDRQQFSVPAQCDPGTGALDTSHADSQRDTDNPTEMVYLYHTNGWGLQSQGWPEDQGTNSEGFYKAVVSFPDRPGVIEAGAPDTPCVAPGTDGTLQTSPAGNDAVLTTRDGLAYVASGADDPNTAGVDEARCDTSASPGDEQLVSNGSIGQPFGLVVTGPIRHAGASRSQIALDKSTYDCSDPALTITVIEEDTGVSDISLQIGAGTMLQVVDASGLVVDEEGGIGFAKADPSDYSGLIVFNDMAYLSEERRVQYVGALGREPIRNNGLIEVTEGDRILATYTDPGDTADTVTTSAEVACEPLITPDYGRVWPGGPLRQGYVKGGCDTGHELTERGDLYFDAGERLQYQVFFMNHTDSEIRGLRATLACENPPGTSESPCQHLTILEPVQSVGHLPGLEWSGARWNIEVDEGVAGLSASSEKMVDLNVTFTAGNLDFGAELGEVSFTFREALQADPERLFYSTDRPYGGTAIVDYNRNGQIETVEVRGTGLNEAREVRTYEDWTGTSNEGLLGLSTDPGENVCGDGVACVPFDFDRNDGGFTASLSADCKPGSGYPTATQGWFWGTGGACGWQTQGATGGPAAPKGVWHAGEGPIGAYGSGCGQYEVPSDPATGPDVEWTYHHLFSPVIRKVNTGSDARGFPFEAHLQSWAWNANESIGLGTELRTELDMNLDDDGPVVLGDSYGFWLWLPVEIAGPLRHAGDGDGARRFGPLFDEDDSLATSGTPTGDEAGVAAPLSTYEPGDYLLRDLMPFPAVDGDPNAAGFTSDERLSTGPAGPCPSVPTGEPCRKAGFTTAAGPVRTRSIDYDGAYESTWGAAGERFQFSFNWLVNEGADRDIGMTLDDVLFEWVEEHPGDQEGFTGGDCSLDNLSGLVCDPADTCVGGPRDGLFCSTVLDCREVAAEGICTGGTCTAGRVGLTGCIADNDCDLGRCVAGNTELGCGVDADCDLATNDCDAIPFRIASTTALGSSAVAQQCAVVNSEPLAVYDCMSGIEVILQDATPALCGPATDLDNDGSPDGCSTSPRQVIINARSEAEPLGETFVLTETAPGTAVFTGEVPLSGVQDQEGILFVTSSDWPHSYYISYDDPECDLDRDGTVGETDFKDIDGDGVPNFGADYVLGDRDPVRTYVTGGPVSDDDNCFDPLLPADVFNPVATAQMDLNGDGLTDAADCVVDPDHNASGQCDFDSDGVGDICDNCPVAANADQLDTDGDGIGNVCEANDIDGDGVQNSADNCPSVYNPSQAQQGGGGPGGSRYNRGELCDAGNDIDGDGYNELSDNCPNEQLVESGTGGYLPGPCPGGGLECTYNPDQLDTDSDGVGDACDSEDYDGDGVINAVDSCVTVYNPADPVFAFQTDSDLDGLGDDRSGRDAVGRCVGGPTPGLLCLPVGTGANCGSGGFCAQSADGYCDVDSQDDDSDGTPDDLVFFTGYTLCGYTERIAGGGSAEIADLALTGVAIGDDGTADYICVGGDPDPGNDPIIVEDCPVQDAGAAGDASCDTPGGGGGDGDCEPVPDGIVDPGEVASVRLTLRNQTEDILENPRDIANATVGIRTVSPAVGCVTRGQVFMGALPHGAEVTTPAGGLEFILSPETGQSAPGAFAEAEFTVTLAADRIEGVSPEPTFGLAGDADLIYSDLFFQQIPAACGTALSGSALGAAHAVDGTLCEDFDTDRNASGAFEFTRLFPAADPNDPLAGLIDPNDDVLGHTVGGGAVPFGVDGRDCATDAAYAVPTCYPVPSENDWHVHSPHEGCDPTYDPGGQWVSSCAPEAKAHSGFRSLHMGRHLNATDTLFDTYRFRQVSAFVMDPVNLGTSTALDFWHIIQVCDDKCLGLEEGGTTAGGQIHLSLFDDASGRFEKWRRLAATQNGYNAIDQEVSIVCEFDPGDDQFPPNDETMCEGHSPQWSDIGDVYGTDRTCTTDTDGNDLVDLDCGETTNRYVDEGCDWVADPSCGSYLENGSVGTGVWARSTFDLSAFAGRRARLRWVFEGGGGWGFGESRSWLEPQALVPAIVYDQDDGWYVDDIRLTDLRVSPAVIVPDPHDGLASCPEQGDGANCGRIDITIAGGAADARTGATLLFAQSAATGMPVSLDARQSMAGDDPNTPAPEGACDAGVLEYRWSRLEEDPNGDLTAKALSLYSPGGEIRVTPSADTLYRVEVRCSSDPDCAASHDVQVLVYTGDGDDLATVVDEGSAIGISEGLWIDHDPPAGEATLTWRARPQPPGVDGYDLFKGTLSTMGADLFGGDQFSGGVFDPDGAGTSYLSSCNLPNGAAGDELSVTDVAPPAAGTASLYMIGHSSTNALAIAPLGTRPSVSSRSGTLISAAVICP